MYVCCFGIGLFHFPTYLSTYQFAATQAEGANVINKGFAALYGSGYWVGSEKAAWVGSLMFGFLAYYSICADITLRMSKRRFPMTPKHHIMAHDAYGLVDQAAKHHWCENPISHTNQVQEDFIGRPSRLSRRVSTRSLHSSVMLRALIIYEDSIKNADIDFRHMDAYPGSG